MITGPKHRTKRSMQHLCSIHVMIGYLAAYLAPTHVILYINYVELKEILLWSSASTASRRWTCSSNSAVTCQVYDAFAPLRFRFPSSFETFNFLQPYRSIHLVISLFNIYKWSYVLCSSFFLIIYINRLLFFRPLPASARPPNAAWPRPHHVVSPPRGRSDSRELSRRPEQELLSLPLVFRMCVRFAFTMLKHPNDIKLSKRFSSWLRSLRKTLTGANRWQYDRILMRLPLGLAGGRQLSFASRHSKVVWATKLENPCCMRSNCNFSSWFCCARAWNPCIQYICTLDN